MDKIYPNIANKVAIPSLGIISMVNYLFQFFKTQFIINILILPKKFRYLVKDF